MTAPAPLVPAEVDLRGFEFMPLDVRRLFTSDTWLLGTFEEKCAALQLWGESWYQVPSASLPDNDRVLALLSRAAARWPKVKAHAMRGWVLCSDGRWYHPVVAEKAMDAFAKIKNASSKGKAGASKRWGTGTHHKIPEPVDNNASANASANSTGMRKGMAQALPVAMPGDSNRQGQGEGQGSTPQPPLPDWIPPDAWSGYVDMRKARGKPLTKNAVHLAVRELEKLKSEGNDPRAVLEQSTMNSWQGLFPVKSAGRGTNGSRNRQEQLEEANRQATKGWMPPEMREKHGAN